MYDHKDHDREKEEKRLISKIQFLGDKLLRSKDFNEQLRLQSDLMEVRRELQKVQGGMYRER